MSINSLLRLFIFRIAVARRFQREKWEWWIAEFPSKYRKPSIRSAHWKFVSVYRPLYACIG